MSVKYTNENGKPYGKNSKAKQAETWNSYYRKAFQKAEPSPKKTMEEKIAEREARREQEINELERVIMENQTQRHEGYDAKTEAPQTPFNPFGNKRFTEALVCSREVSSILPEEFSITVPRFVAEMVMRHKARQKAKEAAKAAKEAAKK